jgi:hypothetical protein
MTLDRATISDMGRVKSGAERRESANELGALNIPVAKDVVQKLRVTEERLDEKQREQIEALQELLDSLHKQSLGNQASHRDLAAWVTRLVAKAGAADRGQVADLRHVEHNLPPPLRGPGPGEKKACRRLIIID